MKDFTFDLFGTEWQVKFVDSIKDDKQKDTLLYGQTLYGKRLIQIATKNADGEDYPISVMQNTLYHELIHVILGEGCYKENDKEYLVEWIGKCLTHLLKDNNKFNLQ